MSPYRESAAVPESATVPEERPKSYATTIVTLIGLILMALGGSIAGWREGRASTPCRDEVHEFGSTDYACKSGSTLSIHTFEGRVFAHCSCPKGATDPTPTVKPSSFKE